MEQPERLVPIDDINTRRELWHGVWDWLIRECERLASESDATPPVAQPRTARQRERPSSASTVT
jgi:hypothetical protein